MLDLVDVHQLEAVLVHLQLLLGEAIAISPVQQKSKPALADSAEKILSIFFEDSPAHVGLLWGAVQEETGECPLLFFTCPTSQPRSKYTPREGLSTHAAPFTLLK